MVLMKALNALFMIFLVLAPMAYMQSSNNTTVNGIVYAGTETIDSPWSDNSKICIFVREWVLKGMFLVVILVFLAGVATISGAAFPEWRNYGSKMIIGSIGAMVLYIIGMQALKFFMGASICGL
jgi:hypothetical protein